MQRESEVIAARRCRLVRRKICIDQNRNHGNWLLPHDLCDDCPKRVSNASRLIGCGDLSQSRHIETLCYQSLKQLPREGRHASKLVVSFHSIAIYHSLRELLTERYGRWLALPL